MLPRSSAPVAPPKDLPSRSRSRGRAAAPRLRLGGSSRGSRDLLPSPRSPWNRSPHPSGSSPRRSRPHLTFAWSVPALPPPPPRLRMERPYAASTTSTPSHGASPRRSRHLHAFAWSAPRRSRHHHAKLRSPRKAPPASPRRSFQDSAAGPLMTGGLNLPPSSSANHPCSSQGRASRASSTPSSSRPQERTSSAASSNMGAPR